MGHKISNIKTDHSTHSIVDLCHENAIKTCHVHLKAILSTIRCFQTFQRQFFCESTNLIFVVSDSGSGHGPSLDLSIQHETGGQRIITVQREFRYESGLHQDSRVPGRKGGRRNCGILARITRSCRENCAEYEEKVHLGSHREDFNVLSQKMRELVNYCDRC